MKRSILDAVREERGKFSNNQLAKKLGIDKRDLLKAYKLLDREGQKTTTVDKKSSLEQSRYILWLQNFFRSPVRGAVTLFLCGFFLRAIILRVFYHDVFIELPILDAEYYSEWAKKIISGEKYPLNAFFTEPGYAYVVALFYKVFGSQSFPIIVFQIILGSLSPVLLFFSVLKFTKSSLAGYIVGFGAAFFGVTLFYDILLLKTSLEFFLMTLIIFGIVYFWEVLTIKRALLLGGLIGLTALVKANILYTVPFLFIFLIVHSRPFITREKVFVSLAFLLGTCMMIAPVTIHNYVVSHAFIPINSSGGANLYIGNWEGADGTLKPPEYISTVPAEEENDWHKVAESYSKRSLNPAEVSSYWTGRTIQEIGAHPLTFFKNTLWKTYLLLSAETLGDDYNRDYVVNKAPVFYFTVPDFLILATGFLGMILIVGSRDARRKYVPLLLIGAGYSATLVVSHVTDRYRVALLPLFFVFVGYVVVWFEEQIYERDFRKIFVAALSVVTFSIIALIPPQGVSGTTISDMFVNFGGTLEKRGENDQARTFYEQSFAENSKHIPTLGKLAKQELLQGNFVRAIDLYRQVFSLQTEFPADELYIALEGQEKHLSIEDIRVRLDRLDLQKKNASEKYDVDVIEGIASIRKHEYEKAAPSFEAAQKKYPESVSVLANLATAYKNTKQIDKAVFTFQHLLEAHPEALQARFNYANLLSEQKSMFVAAINQYEEINRVVPGYYISRYYLGLTYAQAGQSAKAIETLQKFVSEAGDDPAKQAVVKKAQDLLKRLMK